MSEAGKVFMFGFTEEILQGERLGFFKKSGVRNFILFRRNLKYLKENIKIIKNEFESPIIAIDQEGGIVRRLSQTDDFFFGNMNAAMSNSELYIEKAYKNMGNLLKENGINLNLAPVADVYLKPGNSIGIRSFGSSPERVALFSSAAIRGLHKAGVLATIKHFIGYGAVVKDPHLGLPVFSLQGNLLDRALVPFEKVGKSTDFIMSAHIIVGEIDNKMPVTFSEKAIRFLRAKTEFNGPVITDCLEMGGAMIYPPDEIALKALNAGNDLLIVSHTLELQRKMLKSMEKSRLDLSIHIERVESARKKITEYGNTEGMNVLQKFVAVYKDSGFIPKKEFGFLYPEIVQEVQVEETGTQRGNYPADPADTEIESFANFAEKNAVIVVYNAFRHKGQIALAKKIKDSGKRLCVIVAGDPADIKYFGFADCILLTLSPLKKIVEYAVSVVKGEDTAKGVLPVSEEIIWKR